MIRLVDILINIIYHLIGLFDRNEDQSEDKLIWSHIVDGMMVKSESGWSPVGYVHLTRPFDVWTVMTDGGKTLECADEHIIYDSKMRGRWATDYRVGDEVMTEGGAERIVSIRKNRARVCMGDITVLNLNESYYSNGILSHNTTTSAIFMLHYILFNVDRNALTLGNKRKTAIEILDKLKKIFIELPFFLRPGVYKWNEGEVVLDNGCRCMAEATTVNSGISFTFHCILADEFSKIPKNIQEPFYEHVFPTVIAANARFMISSTVNLDNPKDLFYRLYTAACRGENDYSPFAVTWKDVPDWDPDRGCWVKRDENWHRRMIANYGSEEAFEGQFGIGFEFTTNSIIASDVLKKQKEKKTIFINKDLLGVPYSDKYFWRPDYEPMTGLRRDYIVVTTDLAEGLGGDHDYTVSIFNKVFADGHTECVGYYKSNDIPRDLFALSHVTLYAKYCDSNRLLVSFEKNTYGDLYLEEINKILEKSPELGLKFDLGCMVKYYNEGGTKYTYGVKITTGNKSSHCIIFKEDYERGKVINESNVFYDEIVDFQNTGSGYKACNGNHDDMVMAQVQIEFVKETLQWKNMIAEIPSVPVEGAEENADDSYIYNPYEGMGGRMLPGFNPYGKVDEVSERIKQNNINRLRMNSL